MGHLDGCVYCSLPFTPAKSADNAGKAKSVNADSALEQSLPTLFVNTTCNLLARLAEDNLLSRGPMAPVIRPNAARWNASAVRRGISRELFYDDIKYEDNLRRI